MGSRPPERLKPLLEPAVVVEVVREATGLEVSQLAEIDEGHVSQAFAAVANGEDVILRFTSLEGTYDRDAFAARHLDRPGLPVPEIMVRGEAPCGWFAISRRAPGRSLKALATEDIEALAPRIIQSLRTLIAADPPGTGLGHWDREGNGWGTGWADFLLGIGQEEADGLYAGWTRLFASGDLDRELWRRLYGRLEDLAPVVDRTRRGVVHFDFGGDNMIADAGRITGVIDWGNAAYGDTLYDLANLTFWTPHVDFRGEFLRQTAHDPEEDVEQRLLAYEIHHALLSLRFFAVMRMGEAGRWTAARIRELLDERP